MAQVLFPIAAVGTVAYMLHPTLVGLLLALAP